MIDFPSTQRPATGFTSYEQELIDEIHLLRRWLCTCGKGDWGWAFHGTDCPVRLSQP